MKFTQTADGNYQPDYATRSTLALDYINYRVGLVQDPARLSRRSAATIATSVTELYGDHNDPNWKVDMMLHKMLHAVEQAIASLSDINNDRYRRLLDAILAPPDDADYDQEDSE